MHVGHRDPLVGEREQLLQQRLAVAHRPGGAAGESLQRFRLGLDPFRLDDLAQPVENRGGGNAGEVESLAAREDRDRNLRASVVQKMNFTCSGGSSSVFSKALKAWA